MRSRFPILSWLTYLNSCSQGALATDVREAYEQYVRDWEELGSPWELWVEKTDEARAARFQAGTPPIPNVYAGIAGLRLVLEAGVERTSAHVHELTQALVDGTSRRVVTPAERGALVCVEVDDPASAAARLQEQGVITSWRDNSVRFSFHFYNDERDVEVALAALDKI